MDMRYAPAGRLGEIPATKTRGLLEVHASSVPGWVIFSPMQDLGNGTHVSGTNHFAYKDTDLVDNWKEKLV